MTLVRFYDSDGFDRALKIMADMNEGWVASAHEEDLILDLPREVLLRVYQRGIKFELYSDDDD